MTRRRRRNRRDVLSHISLNCESWVREIPAPATEGAEIHEHTENSASWLLASCSEWNPAPVDTTKVGPCIEISLCSPANSVNSVAELLLLAR